MPEQSFEPPTELHLQPGEELRFRLRGAGSAGYRWTWTIDGDAEIISVAVEAASPPPIPTPGVLRGCSVDRIVVVHGLKSGRVRLNLVLARLIQSSSGAQANHSIEITVSPANDPVS
jgi:predicted secreted protein